MKPFNPQLAGKVPGDFFHVRMRESRAHAGVTLDEAAEAIGLTARHLRGIEMGAVTMVNDPMTLQRAATLYGVPSVWLYGGAAAVPKRMIPAWYQPEAAASA